MNHVILHINGNLDVPDILPRISPCIENTVVYAITAIVNEQTTDDHYKCLN
jgi:hypothetical protein